MKQLLFLLLFPCLAMAQYQGNGNQKITLGEQTTADGLVFRGVASIDTVTATSKITRANKQDTSAYLLLDTVTNLLWHYKIGSNAWTQAGGGVSVTSFSAGTTGLTPSTATTGAVTLGGTLAVANGGTGTGTAFAQGSVVFAGASGTYTQNNSQLFFDNTNNRLNIGQNAVISSSPVTKLSLHNGGILLSDSEVNHGMTVLAPTNTFFSGVKGTVNYGGAFFRGLNDSTTFAALAFEGINYNGSPTIAAVNFRGAKKSGASYTALGSTDLVINFENLATSIMSFLGNGSVGVGTITPQSGYRMHIVDSLYVGGRVSAAGYTTRSDYNLKDEIQTLNYGLNEVIQMQPVKYTYKSNGEQQLGFIAQDIGTLIPESVHFDEFMGVDYQSLIPILTKAIQEQNLLIKALEQRILILENK